MSRYGIGVSLHSIKMRAAGLDQIVPRKQPIIDFGTIEIRNGIYWWPVGYQFTRISREAAVELFNGSVFVGERLAFGSQFEADIVAFNPLTDTYILERIAHDEA